MAITTASAQPYNYKVVRQFAIMTVVWGVVGMSLGVLIAAQLVWPELNFDTPWLSFGRLRPLHTSLVIFGFAGCAQFAASYYAVQRTCQVRLFSDSLAAFTFWGWQIVIGPRCQDSCRLIGLTQTEPPGAERAMQCRVTLLNEKLPC